MDDQDIGKKHPDPYDDAEPLPQPESCIPSGSVPSTFKPYSYVVQPEDLNAFWRIPLKFNLPAQKAGGGWFWHELRNANLDWPGGFIRFNDACMLSGLMAGAKLRVPGHWPEPKPGVKTVPRKRKNGTRPKPGTAKAAVVVAVIGLAGVGLLSWMATRRK